MKLPRTSPPPKVMLERCGEDQSTLLRRRYNVWYYAFESQRGPRAWHEGREYVMLTSNDYLGLSFHPKVIEAGRKALAQWGSSTNGARLANGSRRFHLELEEALAQFLGKPACHVSVAGYISVMSSVAAFAQRGDIVLVDKNIHSCVWDGIRLSTAEVERFAHNDPGHLRSVLAQLDPESPKLIVIEGVYSMEGHIAKLPEIAALAAEYGAMLVMDDAHGFGVLGREGRGTASHFGLDQQVDIISGSMSKALASTGGYVAGPRDAIEFLRTHSKQTIFSAALSPCQAACARASLEVMQAEPEHLARLRANTKRYHELLKSLNLDTWGSETPAVPIVLGSKERAYMFWKSLLDQGVFTIMSVAPGVPPGKDLVRTAVSAWHTDADFAIIEQAMTVAAKKR
jgi:8-amino-7-oxononanoate synthase